MIGFLNGILREKLDNYVIIECAGIGYEVLLTNGAYCNMPDENQPVQVYTYMHIRDDELSLFGFDSREEKNLFLQLITVSGVGAKTAIQILSSVKQSDLVASIVGEDVSVIAGVKGIGKKTAERIVLELKDKINPYEYVMPVARDDIDTTTTALADAIVALTSLGISKQNATILARQVADKSDTAEQIIQKALREMGA